jgi:hypothetical protein
MAKTVHRQSGPYSYSATQENPGGTWTIKVTRSTGKYGTTKWQTETLPSYASARRPSSPEAAWRDAGGSLGSVVGQAARTSLRGGLKILGWAFLILVAIAIVFFVIDLVHG